VPPETCRVDLQRNKFHCTLSHLLVIP